MGAFGKTIKGLRVMYGLEIDELASTIGVEEDRLKRIEDEEEGLDDEAILERLANKLKLKIEFLELIQKDPGSVSKDEASRLLVYNEIVEPLMNLARLVGEEKKNHKDV